MARILAIVAAVVCGLLVLADFFLVVPVIDALGAALIEGVLILAAFALILGVVNLLGVHARRHDQDGGRRDGDRDSSCVHIVDEKMLRS